MATDQTDDRPAPQGPEFSEADKKKARAWFKKAADCRDRREYDYAIECFITGLGFWPDAVEEGHMPLRSLAIQRHQAGGKRLGLMEGMKKQMTGKDAKKCMLNAEYLLAKDPASASYVDALLKNANKAGYNRTVKWVAPLVLESLRRDKKPDKARFKAFRDGLTETAGRAAAQGDATLSVWLLEQGVASLEFLLARLPGDEELRIEQRHLSGSLAIERGKYQEAESFQESLQDAQGQKLLHDAERMKQGEQTYEALVAAARRDWEDNPTAAQKVNALVDVLLRRESKQEECEAIALLTKAFDQSGSYSFKLKADDVRLRQLARQARRLAEQARQSGSEEDRQQARLAKMEQLQTELEVFRERVANYPTDLRLKYRLAKVLFEVRAFDEAIPVLQAAQGDPRSRSQCTLLIGRSFFEKGSYSQATEVLKELLEKGQLLDELSKETTYWLARSLEADGKPQDAKTTYGRLLRQDYNYASGDARKRMESLK